MSRAYADCASRPLTKCCNYFFRIGFFVVTIVKQETLQVVPDDHSELVPPLPIPNRTVKRLCADDSAATSVKVGHRQAFIPHRPVFLTEYGAFAFAAFGPSTRSAFYSKLNFTRILFALVQLCSRTALIFVAMRLIIGTNAHPILNEPTVDILCLLLFS